MYVITHHHDYDEVLLGPINWNPRFISSVLQTDLDLDNPPTVLASDEQKIPYDILPNVRVRPVTQVYEEINSKTQRHEGPFWTYTDDAATATWTAVDKPLDQVKGELKAISAAERWNKENAGVTVTVQDVEVWCDTSRGNRDVFLQRYMTMGDADTVNWKFPSTWLTLTKSELGYIVSEGTAYIQSCFDWEVAKNAEIDACTTLAELDAIVIVETEESDVPIV
jgi:hypothetical protein